MLRFTTATIIMISGVLLSEIIQAESRDSMSFSIQDSQEDEMKESINKMNPIRRQP